MSAYIGVLTNGHDAIEVDMVLPSDPEWGRYYEFWRTHGLELPPSSSDAAAELNKPDAAEKLRKIGDVDIVPASKILNASAGPDGVGYKEPTLLKMI